MRPEGGKRMKQAKGLSAETERVRRIWNNNAPKYPLGALRASGSPIEFLLIPSAYQGFTMTLIASRSFIAR